MPLGWNGPVVNMAKPLPGSDWNRGWRIGLGYVRGVPCFISRLTCMLLVYGSLGLLIQSVLQCLTIVICGNLNIGWSNVENFCGLTISLVHVRSTLNMDVTGIMVECILSHQADW